jgi:hypothetical protein
MTDAKADWTQQAVGLLTADLQGMDAGGELLASYLGDTSGDYHALYLKTTTLLIGMMNASFIMLQFLETSSGHSRTEILQDVARAAEVLRGQ